jgi:hypothetical protein
LWPRLTQSRGRQDLGRSPEPCPNDAHCGACFVICESAWR